MTRAILTLLLILLTPVRLQAQTLPPSDPADGQSFRALALHDVRSDLRDSFETDPDETAIGETELVNLFSWLQQSGYQPVSLQQIVTARAGGKPLPAGAVLLSFDDGYRSAYTKVFPLLRRFRYPAVMSLTTEWLEPKAAEVEYGDRRLPRERFLALQEIREMADSGLVEFATHTHELHRGVQANPQGNLLPAAAVRRYDPAHSRYETDAEYGRRVEGDLRRSRLLLERYTGKRIRAVTWPYGAYNDQAIDAARRAGMDIALTLDSGPNTSDVPLQRIRRALPTYDLRAPDYVWLLRDPAGADQARRSQRVMQVDLDYVYDPDPVQQEANLSRLLDRVQAIAPSAVYLQAFADPDGDGAAEALYFPNRHMPVRADLFSRVAWQLRTRSRVQVYAWMPVTAFEIPGLPQVQVQGGSTPTDRIPRLSPFDPQVRRTVNEIYEDLGRHAIFTGLLFHDDARLVDDEDSGPAALRRYAEWGLPGDVAAIRASPELSARWSAGKTRYLIDFTLELADTVRRFRPELRTARNLYAGPVLQPESEAWFAQSLPAFLKAYDYTALMAMPQMEGAAQPEAWLKELADRVLAQPGGRDRTIFELQARDWARGVAVDDAQFEQQVELLRRKGIRNIGYYPDDFIKGHPPLAVAREALSTRQVPHAIGKTGDEAAPDVTTQPAVEGKR
ncbi:MAG TPA: poly-beta-1,6-N-acetyl-D-glucosamine N-deacetylase PgaB [Solimonas sp.]